MDKLIKNQNDLIHDYIYKIESYRALGLEDNVKKSWLNNQIDINKIKNKEALFYGINLLLSQSFNSILVTLIIYYGIKRNISYKIIYVFLLYIDNIIQLINDFTIVKSHIIENKNLIYKIENLLKSSDTNEEWGNIIPNNNFESEIRFNNVNFFYDENKYIFNNFNLIIPTNKITGIYGKSGKGKSTLLKLLLGLYNTNSGEIFINNIKIKQYNKKYYYNNIISYVGQDAILFNGSTEENILGNLDTYDKNLYNKIIKLIDDVPMNSKMSGGQRQRVAICRAFIKNSYILLLDEPTSSLDEENEQKVLKILLELYSDNNITIILVSHKLSTLKICHNLIEL